MLFCEKSYNLESFLLTIHIYVYNFRVNNEIN